MSNPVAFFTEHGLIVEDPRNDGRWHRVPTVDHPKKRNGAYLWDGDRASCQNWATMSKAVSWKDTTVRAISEEDKARMAAKRRERMVSDEEGWERAAIRAQNLLDSCTESHHGYLMRKGFGERVHGLVTPASELFVPMRSLADNKLVGAQLIKWDAEERRWDKKFLPGMRGKGAIYRIGNWRARETILCEGLATGMSIERAINELRLSMSVLVCFSAHNLTYVASVLSARTSHQNEGFRQRAGLFVFADHDAPQTDPAKVKQNPGEAGQRAAAATGLPWTMSPTEDEDANDFAVRMGDRALAAMVLDLRRQREPREWTPKWPKETAA